MLIKTSNSPGRGAEARPEPGGAPAAGGVAVKQFHEQDGPCRGVRPTEVLTQAGLPREPLLVPRHARAPDTSTALWTPVWRRL